MLNKPLECYLVFLFTYQMLYLNTMNVIYLFYIFLPRSDALHLMIGYKEAKNHVIKWGLLHTSLTILITFMCLWP